MPGFGPAAEVLFFREKDPKPMFTQVSLLNRADGDLWRVANSPGSNTVRLLIGASARMADLKVGGEEHSDFARGVLEGSRWVLDDECRE